MSISTVRQRGRSARYAGRRAAGSPVMRGLARIGLAARGVMYVIVGWLAIRIAFGNSSQQADRTGALHTVAGTSVGEVLLWLLVVGFIGLALWRLSEAAYGTPHSGGRKASARLKALARAIIYGFVAYGTLKYALGAGAPQSTNQQSVDLTATALKEPGGRILVIILGLALIACGVYMAWQAWKREFRKQLQTSRMRARTRRVVEWLGVAGGIARGVVFTTAGIFLVVAAADSQPQQAKGIDSSLRALAATPAGPLLLVLVAIGLIMFGVFSCCQARWFRALFSGGYKPTPRTPQLATLLAVGVTWPEGPFGPFAARRPAKLAPLAAEPGDPRSSLTLAAARSPRPPRRFPR